MGLIILLAMIGVPILEIAVFIKVGGQIGLWPTIVIVIATAVIGTALLRRQGLATLIRAQESLQKGDFPVREVFDGFCLLVAGALLLTPGFVTDAAGLLLFSPPIRAILARAAWRYMVKHGRIDINSSASGFGPGGPYRKGPVIDAEFDVIDKEGGGGGDDENEPSGG